ncbi:hypothetical protein YC2023_089315 [Brassica napus]
MVVYECSTCETKEADKGAAKPSGTGVKQMKMALRKKAPRPRGRPRKDTQPKNPAVWEAFAAVTGRVFDA